jgi:vanillate O-demethylase ferredoxin subunit
MIHPWLTVKVIAKRREATDICSYELADPQGRTLPPFSAGAHVNVEVREGLVRQYSLCNPPNENHRYLIAVLLDPKSRGGSSAMHEHVNEGDLIRISEPKNHFPLATAATRTLLFAGGIGVTPILCMAERLAQLNADFEMHYCSRSADRMAFTDRIRNSSYSRHVVFHYDDGADAQKLDAAKLLAQPESNVQLYVCGPPGFMSWILDTAAQKRWPDAQVHREYFVAPEQTAGVAGEFEVQIASTGKVFIIPANRSITAVLSSHGVEIATSCEQGVCGTCITRVLEGDPEHRDVFLTDEERAKNDQMMPCCSRALSRKLVLDL